MMFGPPPIPGLMDGPPAMPFGLSLFEVVRRFLVPSSLALHAALATRRVRRETIRLARICSKFLVVVRLTESADVNDWGRGFLAGKADRLSARPRRAASRYG